jgi:glyoxylase-like metal-dependent hydrolase (beta-lactamase superfamily II)
MATRTPRRVYEMRWTAPPPGAVEAIEDGATFALHGGATLRVVAAPGHTPGNLVAFVEAQGDLYSGDTLLPGGIPTPGLHFPDGAERPRWPSLPRFIASVARLRALEPRRVLPGHGDPVDDPERLFTRFERHQERRQRRIRALLEQHGDSAYGVVRRLFPHLPDKRIRQAMTETIGHLDALAERGEVTSEADADGVLLFMLADE